MDSLLSPFAYESDPRFQRLSEDDKQIIRKFEMMVDSTVLNVNFLSQKFGNGVQFTFEKRSPYTKGSATSPTVEYGAIHILCDQNKPEKLLSFNRYGNSPVLLIRVIQEGKYKIGDFAPDEADDLGREILKLMLVNASVMRPERKAEPAIDYD